MRRNAVRLTASIALAFAAAACVDAPTTAPEVAAVQRGPAAGVLVPGTCTNLNGLNALAAQVFGPGTSPNINSVLGKLKNLDKDIKKGKFAEAKAKAYEIVQFTLKKHNQGGLTGTAAQVKAFTDAVFCFAGIDLNPLPDNTFLILPSDEPQVVTNLGGNAGVSFDANPVSEPTLLEIQVIPGEFPAPGSGPLQTKLDQYPGFIFVQKTSATNAPLTKPAVVGVCADGVIPQEVRDRLRLGHGKTSGFELAAPAPAEFLVCPNLVADAGAAEPRWKQLLGKLLPKQLHASNAMFFGGGVGGTVTEFSPFGPVDPELSFGGGVGGTVTEFIRVPAAADLLSKRGPTLALLEAGCGSIEAPYGSPVRADCQPFVQVSTRLGTPFISVPVSWSVTQGGGIVAPKSGTQCGTFGSSAAVPTDVTGRSGVCWTLGAVGANQVTATPSLGGDALNGVTFVPAVRTFNATANPAAGLVFLTPPPPTVQSTVSFPVDVVIVDKNGERVRGSSDKVQILLHLDGVYTGYKNRADAVEGLASFPSEGLTEIGNPFTYVAELPDLLSTVPRLPSAPFEVVAGPARRVVIVEGDGQSGPAGAPTAIAPKVRVTDWVGHPVSGVTVHWTLIDEKGAVSPAQGVSDVNGLVSTQWTLGVMQNRLRASFNTGLYAAEIIFQATGLTP